MKIRFLQGAILRFTLCLVMLLAPLALLYGQATLTTGTPFNVVNENSGLCIGASGQGTANGTVLQMYTCANGTYSTQLSQEWIFTPAASGYYEVADANAATEAWNVVNIGTTSGSLMQIWSYAGASNEEFEAVSLGNGYYEFIGQGSGLCLDVPGNSTANSVQLDIYTCNNTTAQAFKLVTPSASSGEGPYGGVAAAIPGTVMAENYDTGGQGVGYNVTSINGTDNGYRPDGVDLETASAPATGNDLGWSASGQWFRYTVNVSTAGTYTVTFLVAAESAIPDAFHLSNSSGTNLSGSIAVPDTGGWQTWTTVTASVTLPAGTQTLTLNQDAAGWNIDSFAFAGSGGGGSEGPYGGTPASIPGTVMNENYDTGGQGVGYNVTSTNGTDNGYRSDGVDLELASAPATGNDLGWSASGQWFRYTVNVSTAGTYTVSFLVAAESAISDAFHISNSSGTTLSGSIAVPDTGSWQTWTTVTATVTLPAGVQTLTLNEDNAGWNIDSMVFASGGGGGGTGACSGVSNITVGGTTYTPSWCQEFTGSAGPPSTTAWNFDLGNNGGWGNGEAEVYCGPPGYPNNPSQCPTTFSTSTAPVYIDGNGHLVIQPRNVGGTWISGRMNTEGIQNFEYGILEASIELPNTTNQGLWPAFWTLGSDITTVPWPNCGEADIMENWSPQVDGGAGTTGNNSTVHTALTGGDGVGGRYTFPSGQATDTAFHTYGIVWTPNEMQFFVDNASAPFFTVTPSSLPSGDTWPFNADLFALLNVAIGGTLGGSTSGLSNPGPMTVDYVRYYTAQ
ncbi:MAG: carbohydrate-binding protein [Terracidiphilus sp.]